MSQRILQVNKVIKSELGRIILHNIDLPKNCLCTITEVETSKDLRHAKIWVSIYPFIYSRKILALLKKKSSIIQRDLHQTLSMKPLPRLRFEIDTTEARASSIDKLLDKIKKET
jgi:ribosome-binding factor A